MNYLGIDYGTKRIGLAKATDDPAVATPLYTIPNDPDILGYLEKIVETEGIGEIVVGVPVSFDGQERDFAQAIKKFGEHLSQKIKKPVHFQNEMLTTKETARSQPADPDASAAALILQSFLDRPTD